MPMLPGSNPELARPKPAPTRPSAPSRPAPARPTPQRFPDTPSASFMNRVVPGSPFPEEKPKSQPTQPFMDLLSTALAAKPEPYDPAAVGTARDQLLEAMSGAAEAPNYGLTGSRAGVGMLQANREKDVELARNTLDEALRGQRAHALGTDDAAPAGPGNIRKKTEQMTWEEYTALSPLQRAAVDFNTKLVQAVRRDRNQQEHYDPNDTQRETYDLAVEKMFGEGHGSETYAPETMRVLRQIGYSDRNADLDDFLGLKAAIRTRDLKGLTPDREPTIMSARVAEDMLPAREVRSGVVRDLATAEQRLQKSLIKGNQLLASMNQTAAAESADDVGFLGGLPREQRMVPGFGGEEFDAQLQQAFDILADKKNAEAVPGMLAAMTDQERSSFLAYADARTRNSELYKLPLGERKDADYAKPKQIRAQLNLGGGES